MTLLLDRAAASTSAIGRIDIDLDGCNKPTTNHTKFLALLTRDIDGG